ncbi:MAG: winged helix-turn-helix domain-containing protein [Paracoccaceae bacterium]
MELRNAAANFAFDPYVLDASRRELRCAGEAVHLQSQVFDLLTLLIANAHRVLSRDEIIE